MFWLVLLLVIGACAVVYALQFSIKSKLKLNDDLKQTDIVTAVEKPSDTEVSPPFLAAAFTPVNVESKSRNSSSIEEIDKLSFAAWPKLPVLQLLLSQFLSPRDAKNNIPDYWESAVGARPCEVVRRYVQGGLLVPSSLPARLEWAFKVVELKQLLRDRGLKVSGKKSQLIDRLLSVDEDAARQLVAHVDLLEVAPSIRQSAELFKAEERARYQNALSQTLAVLQEHRIEEAVAAKSIYEASRIFSGGLGMERSIQASFSAELKLIFSEVPSVLRGRVGEAEIECLRLAVAMRHLWSDDDAQRLVGDLPAKYKNLDLQAAISAYTSFARETVRLDEFRSNGVKHVEIRGMDSMACAACRKLIGKRYSIGKVPALPPTRCSCDRPSFCYYSADYREVILSTELV